MAKSYKVTVFAGTKVVADMAQQVKNATVEASLELKPIEGGATEATAVLLPIPNPLPVNSNRKRSKAIGWYKNASGPAWEAPKGSDNTNWWNFETGLWSLGSSNPYPKNDEIFNVTSEVPLGSGYYNEVTARSVVPTLRRKTGLTITYQINDREWETQQYVHNITGAVWNNTENWIKVNDASGVDNAAVVFSKNKNGINVRDYIDKIEVSMRTDTSTPFTYIDPTTIAKIGVFGFGFLSTDSTYNFSLAYHNGTNWVSQPAADRYAAASNSLTFTLRYYQFSVKVTLKKWPSVFTSYELNSLLNKSLFDSVWIKNKENRKNNFLLSFPSSGDIDYLEYDEPNLQYLVKMPSVVPLVNYSNSIVSVKNVPDGLKTYFVKRQEFLYIDVPLRWLSTGLSSTFSPIIEQGNFVSALTDSRGTIPKATLESSDPNTVRIVVFALGYTAKQIIENRLPTTPTKEQVQKIVNDAMGGQISPDQMVKAATWSAKNKLREEELRAEYQKKVDNEGYVGKWYGNQYTEQSADNTIRISSVGDESLHVTLPIQNKLRRCITKNGKVIYYLHADNSELKADGTPAKLDGADGNVMVEIPEHFYKIEEEIIGGLRVVRRKVSEDALPDFIFSPKRYTSAFEATTNRLTNRLVSVCTTNFTRNTEQIYIESDGVYIEGSNTGFSLGIQKTAILSGYSANATTYRGGTNDNNLDGASGNQKSRCQLGRPIANVHRSDVKTMLAEDEFIHLYDTHRIIYNLAFIEYSVKNIQVPFQQKDPLDVTKGGLGKGSTYFPDYNGHANFFVDSNGVGYGGISFLPCGVTNNLGNKSGEVYFKVEQPVVESTGDKGTFQIIRQANVWMPVHSYRGIEQFYGHIYKILDQINVVAKATGSYTPGHEGDSNYQITDVSYFYEPNPYLTNGVANPVKKIWQGQFQGYGITSKYLLGEMGHILPIETNGFNAYAFHCEASEVLPQGSYVLYATVQGRGPSKELLGYNFIVAHNYDSGAPRASDGTRLDHF